MEDDSLHQDLELDAASSSQTLQSSVCDVCQGLFDKESPRGYVLEPPPLYPVNESTRYIYTYIHHAGLEALLASAEAGCRLCAMIDSEIQRKRPVSATGCSPAQRSGRPIAEAKVAQPNEDHLAAMKLAEYGKRERILGSRGIDHSRRGRIIIEVLLDDDSQGRFYGDAAAEIYFSNPSGARSITGPGNLYHFRTPCMFDYHQKTKCTRRLLTL